MKKLLVLLVLVGVVWLLLQSQIGAGIIALFIVWFAVKVVKALFPLLFIIALIMI